jgi:antitoxin (DNA-binding transcriptional repressor) of toxin-antitoxin stability system
MQFVNIHDAKTNLSKYLEQIQNANETIIICKNGQPIAQLCPYNQISDRQLGLWRNKIKIRDDFDELPEDFTRNFE